MAVIVLVLILFVIAYRSTTPEEHKRFVSLLRAWTRRATEKVRQHRLVVEPFHAQLCERTPRAPVAPTLVALSVVAFVVLVLAPGPAGDPDTLIAWGGNYGPRTSNGEWWRLITALFLHSSALHLVVNLSALVTAAFVLERMVGPVGFAAIYVVSGMFSGLFNVSVSPMAVGAGATGAIAGVYGLMLAACLWRVIDGCVNRALRLKDPPNDVPRSTPTVPLLAVKYIAGTALVFIAYVLAVDDSGAAVVGIVTGLLLGLVVARGVDAGQAPMLRVAAAAALMIIVAVSTAVPLRGITDARPEIEAVIALEDRLSSEFRRAVKEFSAGRKSARSLAEFIEGEFVPDLADASARLDALERVPREQEPIVAAAKEYVRLRDYSWRVRSEALRKGRMAMLRDADASEAAALEVFRRLPGTS
jgi:rhomboid protease GluP